MIEAGTGPTAMSFDELRDVMNEQFDTLSPHLQRLARYALHSPSGFALSTIVQIAEANEVQPSSVVRFAKAFGFRGFSDLQKVFRHRLIEGTPELRNEVYSQHESMEQLAEDAPLHLFHDFSTASIEAIEEIRSTVTNESLKSALHMMETANTIYVIGQRRAFPVAAYISYGLARLELKAFLVDFVGGMAHQQIATMTKDDLLFAVSFPPYTPEVVKIVKEAHIREIPVLAVTDDERSPLATHSAQSFKVFDNAVRRFRPLAPSIVLAQTLIMGLGYLKDRKKVPL